MKRYSVKPRLTNSKHFLVGHQGNLKDHLFIGRLGEAGPIVNVDFDLSTPHVVAIFGKRGSGKSYTLGSFLEGLCTQQKKTTISDISRSHAVLVFDTLGIFQWLNVPLTENSPQKLIQEQASIQRGWDIKSEPLDVEIWAPRGTSTLEHAKEFTVNCSDFTASDWGYLFGVDILQDRMGQLLNDVYEKVANEGWSDGSTVHPPKSKYAIEDLIDCIQRDQELLSNYHSETRRAVLQLLYVYWRNPLFQPKRRPSGASTSPDLGEIAQEECKAYETSEGTALNDLLKPGKLSVLLLHKMSDELRLMVIVSLSRKIMQARIQTAEVEKDLKIRGNLSEQEKDRMQKIVTQEVPPTWIVADEAQNFLPSERKTSATDTLVRLVREGRNYGLSFMMTTQQPTAIDQRILAQVDTLIVHKLSVQGDIEYVKRNLKSELPEEIQYGNSKLTFDGLLRSLDIGQAVISDTESDRAFILDVRPRISVHGGFGI